MMNGRELPIPSHYDSQKVGQVWRVIYQQRAQEAKQWTLKHHIQPASKDRFQICLLLVDVQNTFCIPDFELFVGGRSGLGAVEDNQRLCEFIYRNIHLITQICPTMDTHLAGQIFHPLFFINDRGDHPEPYTMITLKDVEKGEWKINPDIHHQLEMNPVQGEQFLKHYTRELEKGGKYSLTIWPYHAMLGGIGHALVSSVEEAIFFHSVARSSPPDFQVKGNHPLTENYSVIRPEVTKDSDGKEIIGKNQALIEKLVQYDALFIAGQAKSHCVAWTIEDLYNEISLQDKELARRIYILEDCMSPVVIPDVVDYTDTANDIFKKFAQKGMQIVRSTESLDSLLKK